MKGQLSENALLVLKKRYLKRDDKGNVSEKPEELFRRVAKSIADAERLYGKDENEIKSIEDSFFTSMWNLEFMPNSPTLMNAGRELGQLSACFVVPVEDSMESIFDAIKSTAMIHKTGGGTGFSFSRLRASNSVVKTTGGVASGPVSFLKVFDAATQAVKQGGTRRGANMGILRVDHPDILDFISCKEKNTDITNFNISVAITDDFMDKVTKGEKYSLVDPHTNKEVGQLDAREVFDLIVKHAHKNGEPGVIFIDKINKYNTLPHLGDMESTNPCGEQPLLPFESCNLGSINLARIVALVDGSYTINWDKLKEVVHIAVRFLDDVIDVNKFPLKEIEKNTKRTRKIGLGVMGWASMLGYLMIPYDSNEALQLAERLMKFIKQEAESASTRLAEERGIFPVFKKSTYEREGKVLRNATLTTVAPTGTISIIAGPCSSGIEPIFALCFYRNVMDGAKLVEVEASFEEILKRRNLYSEELMKKIVESGSIQNLTEIPEDIRRVFVTAHDIHYSSHIKMQAAFQKYVDNAVSKTINFGHDASFEDIKEAYLLANTLECKGITVYRDGSRDEQVLNVEHKDKDHEPEKENSSAEHKEKKKIAPRPRPEVIGGTTTKVSTGCGNLYVVINQDNEGRFFEVFTQMGKAGGCAASQLEATGRLISLALRGGIDVKIVIEQLKGIRCPSPSWANGLKIFSCADAIARALEQRLRNREVAVSSNSAASTQELSAEATGDAKAFTEKESTELNNIVGVCPECGLALRHSEGCVVCNACGYSRC